MSFEIGKNREKDTKQEVVEDILFRISHQIHLFPSQNIEGKMFANMSNFGGFKQRNSKS